MSTIRNVELIKLTCFLKGYNYSDFGEFTLVMNECLKVGK